MLFHFPLKCIRVAGVLGVCIGSFLFCCWVLFFLGVFVGPVLGCLSRGFCWAVGWVPYVFSEAPCAFYLCT